MSRIDQLSQSEYRVAKEITRGFREKEIAEKLFVSFTTVRTHAYNIRKKLGANSAVDIAREFLLSLDNPKKFVIWLIFFNLQCGIAFAQPDIDLRRPTRAKTSRIVKTVRNFK